MTAYTSTQSGNWSTNATWGGSGYPVSGDTAIIASGHVVEIDGDTTVGTLPSDDTTMVFTIQNTGQLKWKDNPGGNWTFTIRGNVDIQAGGIWSIGTAASRIPANRTATVTFPVANATGWKIQLNGKLEVYGAENYHMASGMQRARLARGHRAGVNTLRLDRDVDWLAGDTVWIGNAKYYSQHEEVTISAKVDARTYTLSSLVNHHLDDDFAVLSVRNVILRGVSDPNGVSIVVSNATNANHDKHILNLEWCKLLYFGRAGTSTTDAHSAILWYILPTISYGKSLADSSFRLKGVIFDNLGNSAHHAINVQTNLYFNGKTNKIDGVHFRAVAKGAYFKSYGPFNVKDLTFVRCYYTGVYSYAGDNRFDGYWFQCEYASRASVGIHGGFRELKNFFFSGGNAGIYLWAGAYGDPWARLFINLAPALIQDGTFHLCYGYALQIQDVAYDSRTVQRVIFRNVTFHHGRIHPIRATQVSRMIFENCSFGLSESAADYGQIYFESRVGNTKLSNCQFGKDGVANWGALKNNWADYGVEARIQFRNCETHAPRKEQIETGKYMPDGVKWFWFGGHTGTSEEGWAFKTGQKPTRQIELLGCTSIAGDGSGKTDKLAVDFPKSFRLMQASGGADIRDQMEYEIDDTHLLKLMPLRAVGGNNIFNSLAPLCIPCNPGKQITVKLSFRRNKTCDRGSPGMVLIGPGVYSEALMSAGVGEWEELTVTGRYDPEIEIPALFRLYLMSGSNNNVTYAQAWNGSQGWSPINSGLTDFSDAIYDVIVHIDKLDVAFENTFRILSVNPIDRTHVDVVFSGLVDTPTGTNPSNYIISTV